MLAFGGGLGLSMPAVDAAVSDRVTTTYRAGLLGLRNSTTFLGRATGPVAFATGGAVARYRLLLAVAAAGVLLVGAITVVVTRLLPAARRPEPSA